MNWTAIIVFVLLFGAVTVLGFAAAHWRRGDLDVLNEWGLAGRRLGTVVVWFLLGGDVYTAYTFIAVPALVFGAGAIGFFALPYTIIVYPLVFLILPRMWSVAHKHNFITAGDFVQGRYGNKWLALAVAITGIVATMPYIALQLLGLQVVIGAMGVGTVGLYGDLPLIIAFVILAAFTYTSGLRAPAMIAAVKDTLIYITVLAMVIVIPIELGGYGKMFAMIPPAKLLLAGPKDGNLGQFSAYATLALGSAFALFLYTRWLNPWALIIGWAAGLIAGTWMAASLSFQSAVFPLAVDGFTVPGYAALYALGINFTVSIVLSFLLNPIRAARGTDQTLAADYRF
jgi:SSS family solute:Na+ symporter